MDDAMRRLRETIVRFNALQYGGLHVVYHDHMDGSRGAEEAAQTHGHGGNDRGDDY